MNMTQKQSFFRHKFKYLLIFVLLTLLFLWISAGQVFAEETDGTDLSDYDFSDIQQVLDETFQSSDISFIDIVSSLVSGDLDQFSSLIVTALKEALFSEISANKNSVWQVMLIAAVGALFTGLAGVVDNSHIAETSFFVTYMLVSVTLLSAFSLAADLAASAIETILNFASAFIPAFLLALSISGSITTSAVLYTFAMFIITACEWILIRVMVPASNVYVILVMVNHISKEDLFSRFIDLIKKGIGWGLKTLVGVVTGFSLIQTLILPYVDALKNSTVTQTLSAIPGIGNSIDAVTSLALGSALVIKNGIGTAALIILLLISISPLIKLGIISLMYHILSALIQPLADKRIVGCVEGLAAAAKFLFRMVLTATGLFFVMIAIVCAFGTKTL